MRKVIGYKRITVVKRGKKKSILRATYEYMGKGGGLESRMREDLIIRSKLQVGRLL